MSVTFHQTQFFLRTYIRLNLGAFNTVRVYNALLLYFASCEGFLFPFTSTHSDLLKAGRRC